MHTFAGGFRQVFADVALQLVSEGITVLYKRYPQLRLNMEFRMKLEQEERDRQLWRERLVSRAQRMKAYDA